MGGFLPPVRTQLRDEFKRRNDLQTAIHRLGDFMKTRLIWAAVAILISGAPAAMAQPDNREGGKHQDRAPNAQQGQARPDQGERGHRGAAPAQVQAAPAAAPAPAQPQAPVQAQARPERQQRQQREQAQVQAAPIQGQARPERQQAQRFDGQQRQANPQGTVRAQVQPQVQSAPKVQAFRSNQVVPPRHVQQRNQWQSTNQDWNRSTVWQRDRNWWRGNDAFRNYTGVRLNFFFAPGFGYYSVPQQYRQHSWHPGDYLPSYFMRYVVNDYRSYGLPRPPNNCRWIWVNNSILLVDRSDRYILDEVSNIW
jgi:Ni/Co efflux regulator RcnB